MGEKPPPVEDLVVVPVLLAVRGALVLGPPSVVHEDASLEAGRVLVRAPHTGSSCAVLELGALSLTLLDGSQRRGDDVDVGGVVGETRVPSRCALFCPAMIRGPTHVCRFCRPSVSSAALSEGVSKQTGAWSRRRGGRGSIAVVHRRFSHRGTATTTFALPTPSCEPVMRTTTGAWPRLIAYFSVRYGAA